MRRIIIGEVIIGFSALIDKSRAPNGSVDYFPYYSDVALGTLIYKMVTISEDTVWATPHPNQKVTVLDGATLTLSVPMSLDTVTMREGAQIKSNLADQTGSVTTKSLRFSPDLSGTEWKALGMPLASAVIKNSTEEEISAPSAQNVDNGIWFARLKDNKTPEFVVDESTLAWLVFGRLMAIPIRSLLKELLNSRLWKNLPLQLKQVLS